jgi:hypothetical protein
MVLAIDLVFNVGGSLPIKIINSLAILKNEE